MEDEGCMQSNHPQRKLSQSFRLLRRLARSRLGSTCADVNEVVGNSESFYQPVRSLSETVVRVTSYGEREKYYLGFLAVTVNTIYFHRWCLRQSVKVGNSNPTRTERHVPNFKRI